MTIKLRLVPRATIVARVMPKLGTPDITQAAHDKFWNTSARINRLNDRVFIGDATANEGVLPFTNADWFTALSQTAVNGGDAVLEGGDGDLAQLYVLPNGDVPPTQSGNSILPVVGILTAAQTADNVQPRAFQAHIVNNPPAGSYDRAGWAIYATGTRFPNVTGNTFVMESDVRNSGAFALADPYTLPNGGTYNFLVAAGNGCSATGQNDASAAIVIGANPMKYGAGIIFVNGGIGAHGPFSSKPAIAMAADHEVHWYSAAGTIARNDTATTINFGQSDVVITYASNQLSFTGATSAYRFDNLIAPTANDGAAIGDTNLKWSDLFLASGAVINFNASDVTITHASNLLAFDGASSGYKFDAIIDLSQSTAGQIKFPAAQNASADANTLDDYEEGTWTPTLTPGSGTFTSASASGSYTKIGDRILFDIVISITTNGTAATNIGVSLPFTVGARASGAAGREVAVTGLGITGHIAASGTTLSFQKYDGTYLGGNGYVFNIGGNYKV